jgi:hypothetical protein
MLFREIFAIYSDNRMKHINTIRGQNPELLDNKAGGV